MAAQAATTSPSVRVTRWWMPWPSTITSLTRLQSSAAPGPATASAIIPTWVLVSTNQAWSSSAFFAPVRPAFPLALASWFTMLATSSTRLAMVIVIFSGSLILSAQLIFVTFSRIVVPYSGSGTRHFRPTTMWSSGSPVSWLISIPPTVTVTSGSQCLSSLSWLQARSFSFVSWLWSVSTLHLTPQIPSFLLR